MRRARGGFSMIEVIVALVILTLGMLAMAAGSSYATIQLRGTGLQSQRSAAVAAMIEQVRAQASSRARFDALGPLPKANAQLYGRIRVWYDTATPTTPTLVNRNGLRRITVWTQGPTDASGKGWVTSSVEGVVFDLYRPLR